MYHMRYSSRPLAHDNIAVTIILQKLLTTILDEIKQTFYCNKVIYL